MLFIKGLYGCGTPDKEGMSARVLRTSYAYLNVIL